VKVFGCRPMTDGAATSEGWGRRSKTSKGGNRGQGYGGGAARAMAIWRRRVGRLMGAEGVEQDGRWD
jgi:hypothetical protein